VPLRGTVGNRVGFSTCTHRFSRVYIVQYVSSIARPMPSWLVVTVLLRTQESVGRQAHRHTLTQPHGWMDGWIVMWCHDDDWQDACRRACVADSARMVKEPIDTLRRDAPTWLVVDHSAGACMCVRLDLDRPADPNSLRFLPNIMQCGAVVVPDYTQVGREKFLRGHIARLVRFATCRAIFLPGYWTL
jgi:hypothetical protein